MDAKPCLMVYLCVCLIVTVLGQVGSLCRSNERLLQCGGCQATCQDPVPDCKGVCKAGCYCERDEVRNATGHCVKLSECPPLPSYKLDSTEPRPTDGKCPDNEEYKFCEPCNKTCDNPNPICPAQCARGCFCKGDLVRDRSGHCVRLEECSNRLLNEIPHQNHTSKPIVYEWSCNSNQVYKECENCEKTCSNPNPKCPAQCSRGCFCKDGLLKAPNGQCVQLKHCPEAEVLLAPAQEPHVEDCEADEVYLSCGWCEPTCSEPRPRCPARVCMRGCLCRAPLLRHRSGNCVQFKECNISTCQSADEEYDCHYGCEASCLPRRCTVGLMRRGRCTLGCRCRAGLLRDGASGICVPPFQCTNNTLLTPMKRKFSY